MQQIEQSSNLKHHKGLTFKKLYSQQSCIQIIQSIANKINQFYQQIKSQSSEQQQQQFQIVAICLLKGAFMFYSDLCKRINHRIICEFVKVSSYSGEKSTGNVKIQEKRGQEDKYKGKHVLIIEDMADTGLTLEKFVKLIENYQPKTIKVAVLVERPDKVKNVKIDWVGLYCSDFIIGYGLDYDQFGRNLPAIYQKI